MPSTIPSLTEYPIPVELNAVIQRGTCALSSVMDSETDTSLLSGISLEDLQGTGLETTAVWSDEAVWERMASDMSLDFSGTDRTAGVTCEWPEPIVTSAGRNGPAIAGSSSGTHGLDGGSVAVTTPAGGNGLGMICDSVDSKRSCASASPGVSTRCHSGSSGMTSDCGCRTPPSDHEDLFFNKAYDAYESRFVNSYTGHL